MAKRVCVFLDGHLTGNIILVSNQVSYSKSKLMWVDITREETYYLISSEICSHPLDKSQKHQTTQ